MSMKTREKKRKEKRRQANAGSEEMIPSPAWFLNIRM